MLGVSKWEKRFFVSSCHLKAGVITNLQAINRKQSSQHQAGPSSGCFPREILLSQESWG